MEFPEKIVVADSQRWRGTNAALAPPRLRGNHGPCRGIRDEDALDRDLEDDKFFDIDAPRLKLPRNRFDGSELPANFEKFVGRFLGPYGWVLETSEEGWTITGCALKK